MTPKKLHRFLLPNIQDGVTITITDEHLVHQVVSVLKMSIDESFIIFKHGGPDITVRIIEKTKRSLTVSKLSETTTPAVPRTIIAAVSIIKGSGFELIVQKLTEIGVTAIVPLLTERTVKQALRIDRLQKISNEALEQSGGNIVVTIHEPLTLAECLVQFPYQSILCDAHTGTTLTALDDKTVLYIGPEGGWSDSENELFAQHGVQTLSLGTKILRTETAAIIASHTLLWNSSY